MIPCLVSSNSVLNCKKKVGIYFLHSKIASGNNAAIRCNCSSYSEALSTVKVNVELWISKLLIPAISVFSLKLRSSLIFRVSESSKIYQVGSCLICIEGFAS